MCTHPRENFPLQANLSLAGGNTAEFSFFHSTKIKQKSKVLQIIMVLLKIVVSGIQLLLPIEIFVLHW